MSLSLSLCLAVSASQSLSLCLYLSVSVSPSLPLCLSLSVSASLPLSLCVCLCVSISQSLPLCLSLSISISQSLPLHLYLSLPISPFLPPVSASISGSVCVSLLISASLIVHSCLGLCLNFRLCLCHSPDLYITDSPLLPRSLPPYLLCLASLSLRFSLTLTLPQLLPLVPLSACRSASASPSLHHRLLPRVSAFVSLGFSLLPPPLVSVLCRRSLAQIASPLSTPTIKGIGRATTLALADLGAEVIAVSRTGVEELAKEVSVPRTAAAGERECARGETGLEREMGRGWRTKGRSERAGAKDTPCHGAGALGPTQKEMAHF